MLGSEAAYKKSPAGSSPAEQLLVKPYYQLDTNSILKNMVSKTKIKKYRRESREK